MSNWFGFAQLCMQQLKSRETALARTSLESLLRLVWVYMIRVKGEKPNETNQKLQAIVQSVFPRGSKIVNPKDLPAGVYVKIIQYIAYEKLDFAMKECVYELLGIDMSYINEAAGGGGQQQQGGEQQQLHQQQGGLLGQGDMNGGQLLGKLDLRELI